MLKRLKPKAFSVASEMLTAHLEPLGSEYEEKVKPSADAGDTSSRGRFIGSMQVALVLVLMAVAIYYLSLIHI